jgi:hypothetical protein
MMSESNINRLLFEVIDNIRKIESPRVSMWAIDNKYAYPPYLRFRFMDTEAGDMIYKKLQEIIVQFKGNLEWEMIHNISVSNNFLILPKAFSPFVFKEAFKYERKSFLTFLPEYEYENTIDLAISDVPNLASFIAEQFKRENVAE